MNSLLRKDEERMNSLLREDEERMKSPVTEDIEILSAWEDESATEEY